MKATLYFDGACEGNPGPMGIGAVIDGPTGVLAEISERLPDIGTNNIAEYTAIIRGLEKALELGVTELYVKGDSNLVVQQLLGRFRVRDPKLRPLHERVVELGTKLRAIDVQWIPREQNKRADKLSYAALEPKGAKKEMLGSSPSPREHSILCPTCQKPCVLTIQTFKDGSEHIRQECRDHGFIGYAPNVEPFLSLARQNTAETAQGASKP